MLARMACFLVSQARQRTTRAALALFAAGVGSTWACTFTADRTSDGHDQLAGRVVRLIHERDPAPTSALFLETPDERLIQLVADADDVASQLPLGAKVEVRGLAQPGDRFAVTEVLSVGTAAAISVNKATGDRRVLVAPMLGQGADTTTLADQFQSLADRFRTASLNQLRLQVAIAPSGPQKTCDDHEFFKKPVRKHVNAVGYDTSDYDFVVVFVVAKEGGCGYRAFSDQGGDWSVIAWNGPDQDYRSSAAHELGHNMGLEHAAGLRGLPWACGGGFPPPPYLALLQEPLTRVNTNPWGSVGGCETVDYGDGFNQMGPARNWDPPQIYSAYQRRLLGWPITEVQAELPLAGGAINVHLPGPHHYVKIPYGDHTLMLSTEEMPGVALRVVARTLLTTSPFAAEQAIVLQTLLQTHPTMALDKGFAIQWLAGTGQHALIQLRAPACETLCAQACDLANHPNCVSCLTTCASASHASCHDGVANQDEWGVDCGGSCGACDGFACTWDSDCKSGHCWGNGLCEPVAEPDACAEPLAGCPCENDSDCGPPGLLHCGQGGTCCKGADCTF